jgi:superfamily II DNA or RNA helicase
MNALAVCPTGGGKTLVLSHLVERSGLPTACIAHRNELVGQMSVALAREGVRHNIVGAKSLPKQIVAMHQEEFGRSFYDPSSAYSVGSVQTIARLPDSDPLFARTRAWVSDEAHHFVRENAFGKVLFRFKAAKRGLGVTATPCRADGRGLGRHADGVFDHMVVGPDMRWLIDNGYLTDYRVVVARSDINLDAVRHSASGDFNPEDLRRVRAESRITSDAVTQYLKWVPGKLTAVFDVDVASATQAAAAFRAAGVPAEVLTGEMDPYVRAATLRRFRQREILVLVTVDIISEGFDLPAIEAVIFARPTESYSTYAQQFGRVLRLMVDGSLMALWEEFSPARRLELIAQSGKPRAWVIDLVGNVIRHGLPDAPRPWTLDGRTAASKGKDPDAIPLRTCTGCSQPYERFYTACPYCQKEPEVVERGKPETVDGDLIELDPAVLAALRGEVAKVDGGVRLPFGVDGHSIIGRAIANRHSARQEAQRELRSQMALWAGWQKLRGRTDREAQKLFYLVYGIDILNAQSLGSPEATALAGRITADLNHNNIVAAS